MESRQGDDAENDAPRSYCMFERDRDLPRSASWSPLMAETAKRNRSPRRAVVLGAALMSIAMVWWFVG